MKYRITNGDYRAKAFKVHGGLEIVDPGKTKTIDVSVELSDAFIAQQEALGVRIKALDGKKQDPADEEREQIIADLEALEIKFDKRKSTEALKAELDAATAPLKE